MPTCFVAMGFGVKTAYYGGKKKPRTLDLDKTYENIIKPAAVAAKLECKRADEIQHSTLIDKPMFEQLLSADVVVADISTSNANAIYELGVRHALRPWTTVVMAESEFAFPFDVQHLSILRYEHLGKDIGATEAQRVTKLLTERLLAVLAKLEVDSPVFIFLPQLMSSSQLPKTSFVLEQLSRLSHKISPALPDVIRQLPLNNWISGIARPRIDLDAKVDQATPAASGAPSLSDLRNAFETAKANAKTPQDWLIVAERLKDWRRLEPDDPFVVQQLALATYKSEHPDKITALLDATGILKALQPDVSSDAETVGLWGAIHKRLWEARKSPDDLNEAVRSYARGFYIRRDHYNGVNLAFVLNVRANESAGEDAIADRVFATRVRKETLEYCDKELAAAVQNSEGYAPEDIYWLRVSRAEALLGLGRKEEATRAFEEAKGGAPKPTDWMIETTEKQLRDLSRLLLGQRLA